MSESNITIPEDTSELAADIAAYRREQRWQPATRIIDKIRARSTEEKTAVILAGGIAVFSFIGAIVTR